MFKYISQEFTNIIEIKNSKFIAILKPFSHTNELNDYLKEAQKLYPKASHYCYAYIIGDPHNSKFAGSSDDGEPGGTAGKPMHSVLIKNNLGNVCVIVVRYFGGVKLGAGGLSRAYAKAVGQVVKIAEFIDNVELEQLNIECDFAQEQLVRSIVERFDCQIAQINYSENVKIILQVPKNSVILTKKELINKTNGKILITE
ncbi:YigZ family protein [Lentisphaerota bacterium WC36G]|nr:YigZ family protein [Lentisphaerae bacterium WC36]